MRDVVAQNILGDIYKAGVGVPKNYKEAVKWYRLAADQGDHTALWSLGGMYDDGNGVPKNRKEAVKLFELAAQKQFNEISSSNDTIASMKLSILSHTQVIIGNLYKNGGNGLTKDYVKAYAWYALAAANGQVDAQEYIESLASKMKPVQIEKAQKIADKMWKK